LAPESVRTVVVFAPLAGDAAALAAIAAHEGASALPCLDATAFYAALDERALAAIVTEEALALCTLQDLHARLRAQPSWSDLPLLVLADVGSRDIDDGRFMRLVDIGNVILLTRPTTRLALAMALRSALRARRLQFAVRDQLGQLAGHASVLESTVAQRTRLLEREIQERRRVEQALAEARRLESLGQLTGGIAHDFNNILQVVAGSETLLRMLLAKTPEERVTRALDSIRRATGHGASLTQQLLAYARRQPLASVVLDLRTHLRATSEMMLRMLGPDIRLRLDLAPDAWPVLADPAQLDAALLNIVGNARDAMPRGGELTLQARNWTLPDPALAQGGHLAGDFVGLFITDQGEGMSEDTARQAFEPFFTTKPVGKGTGLGLSQVYGFAIQSHGLAFIRREAVGTTIGILLPRGQARAAAPGIDPASLRESGLAGLCVLYVEDHGRAVARARRRGAPGRQRRRRHRARPGRDRCRVLGRDDARQHGRHRAGALAGAAPSRVTGGAHQRLRLVAGTFTGARCRLRAQARRDRRCQRSLGQGRAQARRRQAPALSGKPARPERRRAGVRTTHRAAGEIAACARQSRQCHIGAGSAPAIRPRTLSGNCT
jgi:signal transduction histidine kinase